jgi:hypothetical protein
MISPEKDVSFQEVVVLDLATDPLPTIEGIGARATVDRVNAVAAVDCIIPAFAGNPIVSSTTVDIIIVVEVTTRRRGDRLTIFQSPPLHRPGNIMPGRGVGAG